MFEVGNCAPTSALFEVALELHSLYGCYPSCAKSGLRQCAPFVCYLLIKPVPTHGLQRFPRNVSPRCRTCSCLKVAVKANPWPQPLLSSCLPWIAREHEQSGAPHLPDVACGAVLCFQLCCRRAMPLRSERRPGAVEVMQVEHVGAMYPQDMHALIIHRNSPREHLVTDNAPPSNNPWTAA